MLILLQYISLSTLLIHSFIHNLWITSIFFSFYSQFHLPMDNFFYKIDTENIYGCGKTNTVRKKDGKLRKNLGAGFKYY